MINGQNYDWESTTTAMPHGILVNYSKIEYSDEIDIKAVYGKGILPRGYGRGNVKGSGKATMLREEFNRLVDFCKRLKLDGFYRLPPFPITVSYANQDKPMTTDRLPSCLFTKRNFSSEQGKEKAEVELEFLILDAIETDELEADTNE